MSNLGFHSLFHRIGSFHGIRAVRFFFERRGLFSPDEDAAYGGRRTEKTLLGCDAIFFTVSFELDYTRVIDALRLSVIPLLRSERGNKGPFIAAGGIAPTANPEILSPVCDLIYLGDMECGLDDILSTLMELSFKKDEVLFRRLGDIPGVYLPGTGSGSDKAGGHGAACGTVEMESGFTRSFLKKGARSSRTCSSSRSSGGVGAVVNSA